jgi:hypothetical protein
MADSVYSAQFSPDTFDQGQNLFIYLLIRILVPELYVGIV